MQCIGFNFECNCQCNGLPSNVYLFVGYLQILLANLLFIVIIEIVLDLHYYFIFWLLLSE